MPLLVELKPGRCCLCAHRRKLDRNGFEVEPFGPHTLAVKAAPVGLEGAALERMLAEVIEQSSEDSGDQNAMKTLWLCARALPPPSPAIPP